MRSRSPVCGTSGDFARICGLADSPVLLAVPYGETRTYGELAADLGSSPRAVGSAVGKNPISVIVPCHRVVGADGSLTGYAGGLDRKRALLALEAVRPQ
ncbi:methylated-DNA--[protein]-cysteine S-methyltransferase [Thermophilibacter provencensis]|uniref:MGMT family protein n=1 Tax=Thermophilibacter provencensis TaxID=1852386 RepID=A0ABT7V252_9ACTN|nr:MGMT family protein [Thermophilibacter provencensis]MDM8270691.1 MGMT family protein [Thermophilibacter provencensis]